MNRMAKLSDFIGRIKASNSSINAIISHYDFDQLLKENASRDAAQEPLVFVLKDNMCTTDLPTGCGSRMLQHYISPFDCAIVERIRQAGGVILGKSNMDEFAMGTENMFSCYGPVRNPLYQQEHRSPGGSSGGSAAAVAARFCDVALGTDTGGSTRMPASLCSVFGFKPSYGRISRYGVAAFAQSMDTVGIIANSTRHVERAFAILDGYDARDPTSAPPEVRAKFTQAKPQGKLRVGIVREGIVDMEPAVRAKWTECLERLAEAGHEIVEVSVPSLKLSVPVYVSISFAEASSNLARYDGVRYGSRAVEDMDPLYRQLYAPTRSEFLGEEVQRRLLLGTLNLTAEAYDEHFLKAQKVRRKIVEEFNRVLRKPHPLVPNADASVDGVDVFIHPTSPTVAHEVGKTSKEKTVLDIMGDVLTIPCNLSGLPAISVPVGKSIGLQVWGQHGDDVTVLAVAELVDGLFKFDVSKVVV